MAGFRNISSPLLAGFVASGIGATQPAYAGKYLADDLSGLSTVELRAKSVADCVREVVGITSPSEDKLYKGRWYDGLIDSLYSSRFISVEGTKTTVSVLKLAIIDHLSWDIADNSYSYNLAFPVDEKLFNRDQKVGGSNLKTGITTISVNKVANGETISSVSQGSDVGVNRLWVLETTDQTWPAASLSVPTFRGMGTDVVKSEITPVDLATSKAPAAKWLNSVRACALN